MQLGAGLTVEEERSVDGKQRFLKASKASFGDFVKSTMEKPEGHSATHTYREEGRVLTSRRSSR